VGSFSKNVALLAIGFWLGCTILFAAVVAPTLFNKDVTLGMSVSMQGAIIGAILRRIYFLSYICIGVASSFLLVSSLREGKGASGPRRAFILCVFVLGLNAANDLWVLDRINKVKVQMANGGDQAHLHQEFENWHKASTAIYGCAVLFGSVAAALLLPSVSGRSRKSK